MLKGVFVVTSMLTLMPTLMYIAVCATVYQTQRWRPKHCDESLVLSAVYKLCENVHQYQSDHTVHVLRGSLHSTADT